MAKRAVICGFFVVCTVLVGLPLSLAAPAGSEVQTFSAKAVMLPFTTQVTIQFPLPICGAQKAWLLQSIQVGPELVQGATSIQLPYLHAWGVSASVVQRSTSGGGLFGGTDNYPLTMVADGPAHVLTSIGVGQEFAGDVTIGLLGTEVAQARFEFNVHITGQCGTPSVLIYP